MNPSGILFRSHLMQQFASAARVQARPPLALASSVSTSGGGTSTRNLSGAFVYSSHARLSHTTTTHTNPTAPPSISSGGKRLLSVPSECEESLTLVEQEEVSQNETDETPTNPNLSAADLQSLIQSRRTALQFSATPQWTRPQLVAALERAVACAQAAPNHKQTEPFRFQRILGETTASTALAEIAYQRTLRKKLQTDPMHAQEYANRKRTRWESIPAFLVTLVQHQPSQVVPDHSTHEGEEEYLYSELDFVPPVTERQLEDYAAACAAVQNVLLSLHAEGLGSKWATGPVIRTPAFRRLCRLSDTERVVGLVMIGEPKESQQKPRRFRTAKEDLLEDL